MNGSTVAQHWEDILLDFLDWKFFPFNEELVQIRIGWSKIWEEPEQIKQMYAFEPLHFGIDWDLVKVYVQFFRLSENWA